MSVPAGWYPDPLNEDVQRFWDGEQWSAATAVVAAPVTIGVPVAAVAAAPVAARRTFVDRHPVMAAFGMIWVAIVAMQWWWLAPTLLIGAGAVWAYRWAQRRSATLAAEAEYENLLHLRGDSRGTYGKFPPVQAD